MKTFLKIILVTVGIGFLQSCADFAELETNPNKPSQVPASLILTGILADLVDEPFGSTSYWNQFWCVNYNYYGTNEYWTSAELNFSTLRNVKKMEESAASAGAVNPYGALAKYFKAYLYFQMTRKVGDLPLADALQGLDVKKPTYESQKNIYLFILDQLEQANTELKTLEETGGLVVDGDIYYGGDLSKWRKAVNSFKLRVLINLSKKENDADLAVKSKFAAILANSSQYPVFTSNADNMNYVYNGTTQLYPTNPGSRGFDKGRYNMADTYVQKLVDLNDPRVFVVANPAKGYLNGQFATLSPDNFGAYKGAPSGQSLSDMAPEAATGKFSYANQKRYYTTLTGPEPAVQMAYWEVCFNIAEGINRGWAAGNAAAYYNAGITASMSFYGLQDGTSISITDQDNDNVIGSYTASLTNYLQQASVTYSGNNATGLNQILTQKYLAFFMNSGLEAYFNFRRTGVPAFNQGPGTGNSGVIPKRWLYPNSEAFYNSDNYKAALQSQFASEVDDVDYQLWEIKN